MPKVLISVSNKNGLKELALGLNKLGFEIVSTGGTYKYLSELKLSSLKKIEELTGFPEIMDGRVKTLHPKVFGGLLADRFKPNQLKDAADNQIELIDILVCNLYPFKETVSDASKSDEEIIENIDIGGVSLLRAAAKNFNSVWVVVDPADYPLVINGLSESAEKQLAIRKELAQKAFAHTSSYDEAINNYFCHQENLDLHFKKKYNLRYGENPHQTAEWYAIPDYQGLSIVNSQVLHGKELSYNNILDADSALSLIREFSGPAAAVIKHTVPCGVALGQNIDEAFEKAYNADSLSAFGGIIILNQPCTVKIAEAINQVFAEVVIAPDFEAQALSVLEQKKNIRLIKTGPITPYADLPLTEYRSIVGGLLVQQSDNLKFNSENFKVVTGSQPTAEQQKDMQFAFAICRHVKSNTIIIARDGVTLGIGGGQTSRVDAAEIAIKKAGDKVKGAICASDGFFPKIDSIDKLAQAGIKSVIQPGGSIKDAEVIEAADKYGMSMVFTGQRAFKH